MQLGRKKQKSQQRTEFVHIFNGISHKHMQWGWKMKSEKQCERKGERTGEKGTHARSHTHARTHTYITLLDVNLIRISRQTEYVSPLNTHEICKIATTKTIIISRKMKCEYRIVDPGSVSFHLNNSVLLTNSFPSLFVCLVGFYSSTLFPWSLRTNSRQNIHFA